MICLKFFNINIFYYLLLLPIYFIFSFLGGCMETDEVLISISRRCPLNNSLTRREGHSETVIINIDRKKSKT